LVRNELDGKMLVGVEVPVRLEVPLKENEDGQDADRGNDVPDTPVTPRDHEPHHQHKGDEEEDGPYDIVSLLQSVGAKIDQIGEEHHDVDHDDDEVEATGEAHASLREAATPAIPVETEDRADDEAENDLDEFEDTSITVEISSVKVDVSHYCASR